MTSFNPGDLVRVDGQQQATIGSWPSDNQGPAFVTFTAQDGTASYATLWANLHTFELVEAGGPVESTADPVDDLLEDEPAVETDKPKPTVKK